LQTPLHKRVDVPVSLAYILAIETNQGMHTMFYALAMTIAATLTAWLFIPFAAASGVAGGFVIALIVGCLLIAIIGAFLTVYSVCEFMQDCAR
jgi:VIT1/CCC1 family predicted Fe2+/Mn2+ transporter